MSSFYGNAGGNTSEIQAAAAAASGSATNANQSALKAEGYSTGTQNGTAVESGSPYYQNNAEYFAEQAATSAVTFETDTTLSVSGKAADAKKTGDEISDLKDALTTKAPVITDTASGAIASFPDGADGIPVKDLTVNIEPVQDLHGYDNPWPAGGGKNKLPFDLVTIKSLNLAGSWTNNVYLRDGITITVNTDGTIKASGQAEDNVYFTIYEAQFVADAVSGTYILNGCPSGGGGSTYNMDIEGCSGSDSGSGVTLMYSDTLKKTKTRIRIMSGADLGTGIVFKPMIRLSSVSDATFAPYENICPITGWTGANVYLTGVNVWDEEWELGYWANGVKDVSSQNVRCKNYIPVKPNTTYYVKYPDAHGARIQTLAADKSFISDLGYKSNTTFTTPANCYYIVFYTNAASLITTYNHDISINYPSTDTSYHAYSGTTHPISWQTEAGTVYGGTLDVTSGVLMVNWFEYVFTGNETWTASSTAHRFSVPINNYIPYALANQQMDTDTEQNVLSSVFGRAVYKNDDGVGYVVHQAGGTLYVVNEPLATITDDIKTITAGTQFVYQLATPLEYQLDPVTLSTLLGLNNIWADTGDVSVDYRADTKLYINKKITEAIANALI